MCAGELWPEFHVHFDIIQAVPWLRIVSHRPLTAETLVRAWVSLCEICSGESGTGTGFFQSSSVFHCQYYSTVAVRTHISSGG